LNSRAFGESNGRTMSATSVNPDENSGTPSPGTQPRFNGFRPPSTTQLKPMSINSAHSSTSELDTVSNGNKPLWNSNSGQQSQTISNSSKSPFQNGEIEFESILQKEFNLIV